MSHQFVRLAAGAADVFRGGGFRVGDDLLLPGVPRDAAFEPHGDVRQVAGGDHAVGDPHRGDRLPAVLHALEEITHVVVALVEPRAVLGQRVGFQLVGRLAVDAAARELQPFTDFAIDAGGDLYLGGCNPDGIPRTIQGDKLLIAASELEARAELF